MSLQNFSKILFSLLLFISCGHIPEDNSLAPIDAGLNALEVHSDGKMDLGLVGTFYGPKNIKDKFISFPLIKTGEYQIVSNNCKTKINKRYNVKGLHFEKYSYEELLKDKDSSLSSCLFSIFVRIDGYAKGMKGEVLLSSNDSFSPAIAKFKNRDFTGVMYYQIKKFNNEALNEETLKQKIEFTKKDSGYIYYAGCGSSGVVPFENNASIDLKTLTSNNLKECVYTLGIAYDNNPPEIMDFYLKTFSQDYSTLALPSINFSNGKLELEAPSPTSVLGINSSFSIYKKPSNKARISKKVGDYEVIIRQITSKGRVNVIKLKQGVVTWNPSIQY